MGIRDPPGLPYLHSVKILTHKTEGELKVESIQIELSQISQPEMYIREKVNVQHVKDLERVFIDSNPTDKDGKLKEGTEYNWPFPDIVVAKNEEPARDKDGNFPGSWTPYELIEGFHRYHMAKRLKLESIPCVVRETATPAERAIEQLTSNLRHGLKVDLDKRDEWIRLLLKKKFATPAEISEATGLTMASISRIKREKQRGEGRKQDQEKNGKGEKKEKEKENGDSNDWKEDYTLTAFIEAVNFLTMFNSENFEKETEKAHFSKVWSEIRLKIQSDRNIVTRVDAASEILRKAIAK